jgi:SAM-dependent methyltransferase
MQTTRDIEVFAAAERTPQIVLLFAPTIFLSAFLLFCSEPMVGKMMLPLLGGAASVWITCLLFFQLMLLAGYGYAHALERYATVRTQMVVHSCLMLLALAFLPMHFAVRPDATASSHPTLWLLGQLIKSVGIPFGIVSTTAPLLQNWLSKTKATSAKDPYFLYAISNAGSLLALLAYPIFVEPRFGVRLQSESWFAAYAVLVLMVFGGAAIAWKYMSESETLSDSAEDVAAFSEQDTVSWNSRLYWLAAAFVPSALMLAVTNHMLLNLASVPFLWVMPLAAYLITFMFAFARRFRLSLITLSRIVPVVLLVLFPLVAAGKPVSANLLWYVLGSHILVLFAGALLCHTALASRRPDTRHLTEFYFWVALGGALGGIFTAVVAPFIFSTVVEYPLLVAMIAFFRQTRDSEQKIKAMDWVYPALLGLLVAAAWYALKWATVDVTEDWKTSLSIDAVLVLTAYIFRNRQFRFALALAVLIFGYHLALPGFLDSARVLFVGRDFFGIKKVVFEVESNMRKLLHGDTLHGLESQDPALNGQPLSYYHETGPVGDVMKMISDRPAQHVGVVGLGTGTMAAWARPNRHVTFYDVDPQVYDIASHFFTFLRRCDKNCDVVIGDGRLSIEKAPDREFDVLMLDAFDSDSIPAHLVSREAVQMYLKRLKPNGLILFHVSNRYMDVEGLVAALIFDASLQGLVRYDDDEDAPGKTSSDYVIAARHPEDLGSLEKSEGWTHIEKPANIQPWTDDYSNMLKIVRWH